MYSQFQECTYDLRMSRQLDGNRTKRLRDAREGLPQPGHAFEIPPTSEQRHSRSSWRDVSVLTGFNAS